MPPSRGVCGAGCYATEHRIGGDLIEAFKAVLGFSSLDNTFGALIGGLKPAFALCEYKVDPRGSTQLD